MSLPEKFTQKDLDKILQIKNRIIHSLRVGGGAAMYDEEKEEYERLIAKAKRCLD